MANTDALRNILEHAEGVGLPEGVYLRVANALRDAFNAPAAPVRRKFIAQRPIKISFNKDGIEYFLRLTRQERWMDGGNFVHKTFYSYNRAGDRIEYKSFKEIVHDFLILNRPKQIVLETDLGIVHIRESMIQRQMTLEFNLLTARLAAPGVTENQRELFEEKLTGLLDYAYIDFVDRVCNRLPMDESPEST